MKLFSRQLSTIYKHQNILSAADEDVTEYPKLNQFLVVVGIQDQAVKVGFYHKTGKGVYNNLTPTNPGWIDLKK